MQVASGYRFQVSQDLSVWVNRLWQEKPKRYSRAMLETLALIAYRQPLTRGDIEAVRGVAVSSDIIKSLQEREWVRIVGHRDVPGKPALYATTKQFLDYFNLNSLDELPPLSDIRELEPNIEALDLGEELIQVKTLELSSDESPGDLLDDEKLDQVAEQVDVIERNIKRMFNPEPDEDAQGTDQLVQASADLTENSKGNAGTFANVPADILNAAFAEDDPAHESDDES